MDKNGLSSFLLGLGVGVAIGMLFAPKSGEETRELIKNKAGEGSEYLKQRSSELKDTASGWVDKGRDAVGKQKENLNEAMEAGKHGAPSEAFAQFAGGLRASAERFQRVLKQGVALQRAGFAVVTVGHFPNATTFPALWCPNLRSYG